MYTNLKDRVLASLADHYFLSNHILLSFPQIIPSALFIKEKKEVQILPAPHSVVQLQLTLGKQNSVVCSL